MGVLQDFEKRLEGAVEGFFARAFRSGVQPIELARAVQRYAEDTQHVTGSGVVVPNVYRVGLNPRDIEKAMTLGEQLPTELAEVVTRTAKERGWDLRGPVVVKIVEREEVAYGTYELAGRVEVVTGEQPVETAAPNPAAAPAEASAEASADEAALEPEAASSASDVRTGETLAEEVVLEGRADADAPPPLFPQSSHTVLQAFVRADEAPVVRTKFRLRVGSGAGAGHEIALTGGRIVAGRLPGSGLLLDDPTVSRQHAAFVLRGDTWWVVDLGSTNGTRVNGTAAAEQPLQPGDEVLLGEALISFVEG